MLYIWRVDRGRWNETKPMGDVEAINITGLQPGEEYTFRVVALNVISDIVRETRSDPHTVKMEIGNQSINQS